MRQGGLGRIGGAISVVIAASALAAAVETPSSPDAVLAKLQAWLNGAPTLTGRFEQRLVSGALGDDVVESGRLWIRRPGEMRWDYESPDRKVAVVRDGRSLLYIEPDRQAIERSLGEEGRLLFDLLAGNRPLDRIFEVAPALASDPGAPEGHGSVRLRPRESDGTFESVTLVVRMEDGAIVAVRVRDATGNVMDYRFRRLRRGAPVGDDVFAFEPPPGTEILKDQ